MIWASTFQITLAIWVRVRVRVTGDASITGVLGMGMPKTRGYPYHSVTVTPSLPQSPRVFCISFHDICTLHLGPCMEQAYSNYFLALPTLVRFVLKCINFAALRPSVHTDKLNVFTEKASI